MSLKSYEELEKKYLNHSLTPITTARKACSEVLSTFLEMCTHFIFEVNNNIVL